MSGKEEEIKSAQEVARDRAEHMPDAGAGEDKAKEETKQETAEGSAAEIPAENKIKLNFYSYLIMLGAIGWQFLGKIPNPQTGKVEKDLLQAQEIIDLLAILEEKTKGNLSKEEDNILKATLSNLRLNYVEEVKK